ncbi:unnamed protein product [Parnassius mnemosyne]|uniref:PiggyBac transposable element-derived protein domain-containing protein n=1 Tax=Parnassius mnemosyne TaxID=213953 RepID=A0AAV1KNL2_9NEOP
MPYGGDLKETFTHFISYTLIPGESIARQNERVICVLKWKSKRDVLMLSTKHSKGFTTVVKKGRVIRKPKVIVAYNKAKGSVDISDQMTSYSSPLRKTVKWYKKLAIELVLNTALVNSWVMYCENKKTDIELVQFRRQLVDYLTQTESGPEASNERPRRVKHKLQTKEATVRSTRRFCAQCYKTNVDTYGSKAAKNKTKKVSTFCSECDNEPHLCLPCFNRIHKI